MPRTYSSIHLHIIFATKHRQPWLKEGIRERTHAFLGGIVKDLKAVPIAIGGVDDHVHVLVRWRTDETIATLVREAKARSSRWMHEEIALKDSAWQEGYTVFP